MVSPAAKVLVSFAMLAYFVMAKIQDHGHIRGGGSMALLLSENTQGDTAEKLCDASNGQGCQRHLSEENVGHHNAPPDFIPTHEWQDILPNQAIPPVSVADRVVA